MRTSAIRHLSAFTLIELLTVISILGIIAALTVPALKQFGKSDASLTAAQQMLRDVGRARQLAIANRTTVYMVFVPMNFWTNTTWYVNFLHNMTLAEQSASSNLCEDQLSGYTFVAYGALGDQPGNHAWHYLAPWQSLPEGNFIADWKFNPAFSHVPVNPFNFSDPANSQSTFNIYSFDYTNNIPFPSETGSSGASLPYIAFNYLGQLVSSSDQDYTGNGVDIPLVKGSVLTALDPATKTPQFNPAQILETPAGNGTNISYTIVHVDPLTGRATLLFHALQ
jgi:prepilin-type N-terminal cleavage/methylation domain-containing protein